MAFSVAKPIIGMLHAPPLPGSPGWRGDRSAVRDVVLRDAAALVAGGVHGLMLENFGDAPFAPQRVEAETVAALTWLAAEVRGRHDVPLGINVLRNDGRSALAIATAVGAEFIRVNVLCGVRVTDQGLVNGIAYDLLRDRARVRSRVDILADVDVKHSAPLVSRPLAEEVAELLDRGGAGGLIVTGTSTGATADRDMLHRVKTIAGNRPVFVGSGITVGNLADFSEADGFIVGSGLKEKGDPLRLVDPTRVLALLAAWRSLNGAA